jgi:proteasome accessory factor B
MNKLNKNGISLVNKHKNLDKSGPSTRTGIERLFKMVGFLQNQNIDGEPVNCSTIMKKLEVDRSTVLRDLSFLRDRLEVEFEWDQSENAYILTGECKSFPCMVLNDVDKLLFEFLEHALCEVAGESELGVELQNRFRRFKGVFTGKNSSMGWGINASFAPTSKAMVSDLKAYNTAQRAIHGECFLKVTCKTKECYEPVTQVIKPQSILFQNGQWWLKAFAVDSGEDLQLALGEMMQIEIYKDQDKIGIAGYVLSSANQTNSGKAELAALTFFPSGETPLKAA